MDRKSLAIILGVAAGVAAVATVGICIARHRAEPVVRDVNTVFEKARRTIRKLDEAVESLRTSAA